MNSLFGIIGVVAFFAGAYFLIKLILALVRGQPKGVWAKKIIATIVIFIVAAIGDSATREKPSPEKIVAQETHQTAEQQLAEKEKRAEEKAAKEAEAKRLAEEKAAKEAEEKRLAEERAAQEKAEAQRLAEEKKAQEAEDKRLTEEKKAQEKLAALEKAGKIQYQDLGNGTYNVILTERATFKKYLGGEDSVNKLANYALQDEHERNILSTANQCMQLVQTVKDAGIKVNNFTVNLTGQVEDMAGYKSVDNVVICEISGSKHFKKDDPYSFYNNTDRFWMINGL